MSQHRLPLAVCLFLAACGGAQDPRAERPDGFASCTVADVSGSTRDVRPAYVDAFRSLATETARDGSGLLCVVLAAGDPQAEGTPAMADVGPAHENPIYAPSEIARAVETASGEFDAVLRSPPVRAKGSAIVEACAVAARKLRRGDRLLVVSDGLQRSDLTGSFYRVDLSPPAIEALLDRIDEAGLLPDLSGVTVSMPHLLAHPGGLGLGQAREQAVRRFWAAWVAQTGATPAEPIDGAASSQR